MTGIADDHDAALEIVRDAYKVLRDRDPTNKLLKYVSISEDGKRFDFRNDLSRRFRRGKDKFWAQTYVRYAQALEEAAK